MFCHGPDENTREADLRLDVREDAAYVLESDELLERIRSDDVDMRMPPPESKLSLTEAEKQLIEVWLETGAPYAKHWAFELLPQAVELPPVHDARWPKQQLDHFVLHKLESAGVSPAPQAAPLRWLRRVTMDLTGLPPRLEEIRAFQAQYAHDAQAAYVNAVEQLLDSPAYGQHMAIGWLDLARYADSYGYQSDKLNTQWPYRDWVVRAFNENLPYDQFLTWQLAGDLQDNATEDQRLATAFNRIHRLNNEGGAVFEEWRIENVSDRVHTFGTAVLGLTLECCRCHDHKYDPISMRDYYSLSAFFNSIDESGVYDRTAKVPCPSMLLPTSDQAEVLEVAKQSRADAEQQYQAQIANSEKRWQAWQASPPEASIIPDLKVAISFDREFDNSMKDVYHPSENDRGWTTMPELLTVTDSSIRRLNSREANDLAGIDQAAELPRRALALDGERGATIHGVEPLDRWTPFSVIVTFRETSRVPQRSLLAHHTRGTDCGYNGWDLTLVNGYVESRMGRVWPGNAIGVRTIDPIPADQWHQLAATYDGSSKAVGLKLFLNGRPLPTSVLRDNIKKSANVKVDHGGEFVVGQRFRARGLAGGLLDDVRLYTRDLTQPELEFLAGAPFHPSQDYFVSAVDEACRNAFAQLNEARHHVVLAEESMTEIPVMHEMDQPRSTHVLARGRYDAPIDEETKVERDVPSELSLPFLEGQPRDRLGLAAWATHPSHPLTARVAVNHLWARFFEAPLVRTPENFGLQGELPTHPQLLDWLARDLINSGWDVKRFCRQVALSATYRQDSVFDEGKVKLDPENRLLSRGPSHRYSAEQIRDLALAASRLLNPERGGPPVSPYQPGEDLWKEANGMSPAWKQSVGQSLYRRSLYSVWKRTVPLPNMMAFDATTREVCTVSRSRTNTPLQALVLLNDVQFVEASRVLAQSVLIQVPKGERADSPEPNSTASNSTASKLIEPESIEVNPTSIEQAISNAFLRLASREPDPRELEALTKLFLQEQAYFADTDGAAEQFLDLGDSPVNSSIRPADLAAMTSVCQAIFNLDATVWKR